MTRIAIFAGATWNSLGAFGTLLAAAFFAVIIWLLIEWGLLALDNTSIIARKSVGVYVTRTCQPPEHR